MDLCFGMDNEIGLGEIPKLGETACHIIGIGIKITGQLRNLG